MLYTISNDLLDIAIESAGAELMSIKTKDGHEYLWQGDSTYWGGRAYNLFPICGRLTEGKYTYKGKTYEGLKSPHGFIRKTEFVVNQISTDCVEFCTAATAATKEFYPFDFTYTIRYALKGETINMHITVSNKGVNTLIFSLGGHPGFNAPLSENSSFEDAYIEFANADSVQAVYMSDTCYTTPKREAFPLENGSVLPLKHSLFDRDAIVLEGAKDFVALKDNNCKRAVIVKFPTEMKYLGIWHAPQTNAPFVALEPWCSLPAYDGEIDNFETKPDMFRLAADSTKQLDWSITVK